jgi:hypothetical protein
LEFDEMKSKLCIALLWVLVFLLGGIAGGVSYYLYHEHMRSPKPEDIIKDLARDLKLDAQQTESLKAIFDESIKRYKALNQQVRPQFRAIRNETAEKIKGILRSDQKLRYEERLRKLQRAEPPQASPPPPPPAK